MLWQIAVHICFSGASSSVSHSWKKNHKRREK